MSALALVIVMLIAIIAAIAAVLITVAASSYINLYRVRREPSLLDARQAVIDALSGQDSSGGEALDSLSRLSGRYIVNVMLDLAPSFNGTTRSVLVPLGERIGILPRARKGVHSRRWSTRLYSARVLTAFGTQTDDLWALFDDHASEVRAQAAVWAVVTPSPRAIGHLIDLLSDADGHCRFTAQDALIRIGSPGTEALIAAMETPDGEFLRRLLRVAGATGDQRFYSRAISLTADPSPETRALAVAVVARIGDPSAGPTLTGLLDDPSDDVILAAAKGLAKLGYWPAAVEVEGLLNNASWNLRNQASLTLLAFGAPGIVLLRANAPGDDPASEISLRALELRSLAHEAYAA